MRVTFILPGSAMMPGGGHKIVYQYANCLASRGHHLNILQSPLIYRDASLTQRVKALIRYPQRLVDKSYRPDSWFTLDPRVHVHWVPSFDERYVPEADVIVATAWMTAEWVARYNFNKGCKFYLIQHKETWWGSESRVMSTWRLPLIKIAIARWLQQAVIETGEACFFIPNAVDFNAFGLDRPIHERDCYETMMLYHILPWKGSADGLSALEFAKREAPHLKATLFGTPKPSHKFPQWIRYYRNPPQKRLRELYNNAAIFVGPSWSEGWGLPPAEAMMCGAAFVGTDNDGHREFAIHGQTALLSAPKDARRLADNILCLLRDQECRIQLARSGHFHIQQFTWKRATDIFEKIILGEHTVPNICNTYI